MIVERAPLGQTDIRIPRLIFGTSALGNLYQEIDKETKREIVSQWFEVLDPPVCIDSAGKYGAGLALEEIGEALRTLKVPAADIVISNKLGWKRVPLTADEPTFEPGVWRNLANDAVQAISYEGILECWAQGNELLGSGYTAQLLSVHDPDEYLANARDPGEGKHRFENVKAAYGALTDLKKDGKATAIGVGSKDWRVIKQLANEIELDWVMLAGSLTVYRHSQELLDFLDELQEAGVYVINSAVFNSGFLVGGNYLDYQEIDRGTSPAPFRWRDRFFDLCRRYGVSPAAACVEFGSAPASVSSVAMNTTRPDRIIQNVRAIESRAPAEFWNHMLREGLVSVTPEQLR
jgi:D-threo-aldose 1-dehydrogenase